MITKIGKTNPKAVLNFISSVGEKILLPNGIIWLTDILKNHESANKTLSHPHAEILIDRLFFHHISVIKKDTQLIDDFIWILNGMVNIGSSKAYFIRENVITYKSA